MGRVAFFNFPITDEQSSARNPLTVIKQVAQPGDFVVFKLDIDNSPVENAIVAQLQSDPEAYKLVDIFFYERE